MFPNVEPLEQSRFLPNGRAAPWPDPVRFGVLGRLEVGINGRALELPRGKGRALLALLLLRVGDVVSKDRLVDGLWNESPPKAAIGSLQNYVSALRKALGAELVRTSANGYLLDVPPQSVDARRFEQLAAKAYKSDSLDECSRLLREALSLWRGPALEDFSHEPFAQVEIARLEELRTAAREELIDLELALGHHSRLVCELEVLVASHPLRERSRAQLMVALYRSGRQAEALEVYRDGRRAMHEQLGLEPGPELRALEQAILAHDPLLWPAHARERPVGDGRKVFTGPGSEAQVRISSYGRPPRFVLRLPTHGMATSIVLPDGA